MKIGRWSTTAGNNNTTPPDGWPEGQAPSTVNDCAREMMAAIRTAFNDLQYVDQDFTPTFISATSFSVPGNQTSAIHAGRRLKLFDATAGVATVIYATVATASFTAVTTIDLTLDAGNLTSSLSSFAISIFSRNNSSFPAFDRISASGLEATALSLSGNAIVKGNLTVSGQAHVGALSVGGAGVFGSTVTISGAASLLGNLSVSGQAHLGQLSVGGAAALGATLTVSGAAAILGALSVGGATVLGDTLTVSGAAAFLGTITANGAITAKTTLSVSGQAHVGALSVGGAAALGGTLTVSGATALLGALSVGGAAIFGTTLTVSGAAAMLGALSVGGAATFGTTFTVSGATVLKGALSVGGAAVYGTTLTVSGAAAFLGAVRIAGGLSAEGAAVTFPASPNVNAGVNTLDNYEEGSWTPNLLISATNTGITYATQAGTYTRIGNKCFYNAHIALSSKGALAGPVTISGLPFASFNGPSDLHLAAAHIQSATACGVIQAYVIAGQSAIQMVHLSVGVLTNLSAGNIFDGSVLRITGFYRTAT